MTWKEKFKNLFAGVYDIPDIVDYYRALYREYLMDNRNILKKKFKFLIRKHIREQITWRMFYVKKVCMDKGYCHHCGCDVPSLQYANNSCKEPCYPTMMNKKEWNDFQKKLKYKDKKNKCVWFLNSAKQLIRNGNI